MRIGAMIAGALTVLATVAALAELWWLTVLAAMTLLAGAFLLALDADRRVRSFPEFSADLARRTVASYKPPKQPAPVVVAAPATEQDVLGAVRVLQAQYVGRLDRLQTSLEQELGRLRAHAADQPGGSGPAPSADDR
jgi:hypothetical protein